MRTISVYLSLAETDRVSSIERLHLGGVKNARGRSVDDRYPFNSEITCDFGINPPSPVATERVSGDTLAGWMIGFIGVPMGCAFDYRVIENEQAEAQA